MTIRMATQPSPLPLMFWIRLVVGAAVIGALAFFGLFIFFAVAIVMLSVLLVWQIWSWFQPQRAHPRRNMQFGDGQAGNAAPPIEGEFVVVDESRVEIIPPPRRPGQDSGS